ncbi:MAG TPA: succinate dehydrogenase/fumarate reductase flavoprotein subunit [Clostridiales bacterium]|nr:succinate dehydrogenase/fumarate reductase flavoprotein subunit [Clostridiales bacterium]
MYPDELRESALRVAASRDCRLKEKHPRLAPDEKDALLRGFHPDFREDTQRPVTVGPNSGARMPHELVDLLEARSRFDPEAVSLDRPALQTDVLIIGGGGAGVAAALTAQEEGARVLLVTKLRLGDANTMMAQGGIQAATSPVDSPAIHYLDVLGGGGYTNDPALVRALVRDAPAVIAWLEELGCMFSKQPDGTLMAIHGGGTSRKRMHFARDYTGAEIMRTLRDELLNREVPVIEFCPALELLLDDQGRCGGAVLQNFETGAFLVAHARVVILATGGFGRLHVSGFPTTNHYGATADGLVMAYRAGAELCFLDATQFHPTGVAYPEQMLGQLVTEKVRGVGAQLVNADGEQFVFPLETRDAVSAAIIRECGLPGKGVATATGQRGVWVDSPMIERIHGPGTVRRELPAMFRQYERFGIDMSAEPILIYPTLHYQNGGIRVDPSGSCPRIPGLYIAGEAAGGIHGRNRLMGNSLLDILVFGRRAGRHAASSDLPASGRLTLQHVRRHNREVELAGKGRTIAPMLLPDYVGPEPNAS